MPPTDAPPPVERDYNRERSSATANQSAALPAATSSEHGTEKDATANAAIGPSNATATSAPAGKFADAWQEAQRLLAENRLVEAHALLSSWYGRSDLTATEETHLVDLLGVAVSGGMFVVPLYAFLTTTVPKSETARTIAANNIVNSGLMVAATLILTAAVQLGVTVADSLLIVAVATIMSAWLGWKPHLACD